MARILHVIHEVGFGGAARSMLACAKYSAKSGCHRHRILTLSPSDRSAFRLVEDAGAVLLDAPAPEIAGKEMEEADIVQVHWWNVPVMRDFLAGEWPACRLMIFYHVAGNGSPHIVTPELVEFADLNVPCNPFTYLELPVFRDMDPDLKRDNVALVYDATDFARLAAFVPRPHRGFNVGYIGTVDFLKMHPRYVEMSAGIDVPEARFIVCGNGQLDVLRAKAEETGQAHRFHFKGYVEDIGSVLEEMDVYGYPLCEDTYAAAELNLQEAMYCGIPPVVFPYGGVKSLVINEFTGLVVHSEREYREAIEHLYAEPDARRRMGANARTYAKQIFGAENAAGKMNLAYAKLLERPKRHRRWPGEPPTAPAIAGGTRGNGCLAFMETLGEHGEAFRESLTGADLESLVASDMAIARISRLAGHTGVFPYRYHCPHDPFLRFWSGLIHWCNGAIGTALNEFAAAASLGFPHWRGSWYLAQVCRLAGHPEKAEGLLEALMRRFPEIRGVADRVLVPALRSAGMDPLHASSHTAREKAANSGLARDGAAPRAESSGTLPPWKPGEQRLKDAFDAFRSGEYSRAAARLHESLMAGEGDGFRILNNLGVVKYAQGRPMEARRYFSEALKLKADYRLAILNLGQLLVEQGMREHALRLFQDFLDGRPSDKEVGDALQEALKTGTGSRLPALSVTKAGQGEARRND